MADRSRRQIVLVRHGETEWSSSGQHTSFSDIPLTERGREQARTLAPRLRGHRASRSSSPARAQRAVRHVRARRLGDARRGHRRPRRVELRRVRGPHDASRSARSVPDWTIFTHGAPGGETADAGRRRAPTACSRASPRPAATVALFSHGHFLRVLGGRDGSGSRPSTARCFGLDTATLSVLGHEREQRVAAGVELVSVGPGARAVGRGADRHRPHGVAWATSRSCSSPTRDAGLRAVIAIHSTALGPVARRRAVLALRRPTATRSPTRSACRRR